MPKKKVKQDDFIKASVSIECETCEEVVAHLLHLAERIKKDIKDEGLDKPGVRHRIIRISDVNCYGIHTCIINIPK